MTSGIAVRGRRVTTTGNEPQRRETPRNIVGLLCCFVTRPFHDDVYSHKYENSDREQKYFCQKSRAGSARARLYDSNRAGAALRQNNVFKKDRFHHKTTADGDRHLKMPARFH
jgi:hypothetical protein